jgi:hypothetical protein
LWTIKRCVIAPASSDLRRFVGGLVRHRLMAVRLPPIDDAIAALIDRLAGKNQRD